jgi:hypothetical protein
MKHATPIATSPQKGPTNRGVKTLSPALKLKSPAYQEPNTTAQIATKSSDIHRTAAPNLSSSNGRPVARSSTDDSAGAS